MIRETIARIIDPWAWLQFDAAIRPFIENRGAQDPEGREQFWYALTYGRRNHRCPRDVENWFMTDKLDGSEPGGIFMFRDSLTKADAIIKSLNIDGVSDAA